MCQKVCYFVKEQFKLLVTFSPIIMADTKISDLNINLLPDEKEIFSNKSYRTNGQNLVENGQKWSASNKGLSRFCFCFSLKQLISIPTRLTSKTATLIDHVSTPLKK